MAGALKKEKDTIEYTVETNIFPSYLNYWGYQVKVYQGDRYVGKRKGTNSFFSVTAKWAARLAARGLIRADKASGVTTYTKRV